MSDASQVDIVDWVAKGSFKGDLEVLDKAGNSVGRVHLAVKFERPGAVLRPSLTPSS